MHKPVIAVDGCQADIASILDSTMMEPKIVIVLRRINLHFGGQHGQDVVKDGLDIIDIQIQIDAKLFNQRLICYQ